VYNVGGGKAITVLEFAKIMLDKFGSDMKPLITGEFRLGDTRHTVSDISKLRKLGWEPTIPVEQNVEEYITWIKQQSDTKEYFRESEKLMKDQNVIIKAKTA
jgi:dTDP-L-rhamnose 4-epimerase